MSSSYAPALAVSLIMAGHVAGQPAAEPERESASTAGPYLPHSGGDSGGGIAAASQSIDLGAVKPEGKRTNQEPKSHEQGQFDPITQRSERDLEDLLLGPPKHAAEQPAQDGDQRVGLRGAGDSVREFEGIGNSGWIPPDNVITVGREHLIQATNSGFTVHAKAGRQIRAYTSFASFFAGVTPVGWNGFMFDPRVHYVIEHDRYVMLILGRDDNAQTSHFFIAVTQTNDPTLGWTTLRYDNTFANAADSNAWIDYCSLSGDTWGVYVSCNMFLWTGGFKYAKLHALNPEIFSGGGSNGWAFWNLQWPSGALAFTVQPAAAHSIAGGGETFLVNTHSSSGSDALLWTLTGDRTNSPSLAKSLVDIGSYDAIFENIDQPDVSDDIDGGDARVLNAVYAQRHVFATLTHDVNADSNSSGAYTFKINVDSASMAWDHLLWSGDDKYVFKPAIAHQGSGTDAHLGVVASYTSVPDGAYASAVYKLYIDHPNSPDGPYILYENGDASYVARDSGNRNRWGDYSGASYDWFCQHWWGGGQLAGTNNNWRTRITARTFADEAPCSILDLTSPTAGEVLTGNSTKTLTWTGLNLAGQTLTLAYTLNGGNSWTTIASGLPNATTVFNWTVPDTFTAQGQIRVSASSGAADHSDGYFTILPAGCTDDAWEEDDVCFGNSHNLGVLNTHLHCDVDWAYFLPQAGVTYAIETTNLIGGADTVLSLYANCAGPLITDDDGGSGVASRIEFTAPNANALDVEITQFGNSYQPGEGYDLLITECDTSCDLIFHSGVD